MQEDPKTRDNSTTTVVILLIALVVVIIFVAARSGQDKDKAKTPFARGKQIYRTICIACHHPDPEKEYGNLGTFGPAIAGSSYELLKMRVLTTSYPKGYKPKRDTQLMTTFDLKEDQLRALHTYINRGGSSGSGRARGSGCSVRDKPQGRLRLRGDRPRADRPRLLRP